MLYYRKNFKNRANVNITDGHCKVTGKRVKQRKEKKKPCTRMTLSCQTHTSFLEEYKAIMKQASGNNKTKKLLYYNGRYHGGS